MWQPLAIEKLLHKKCGKDHRLIDLSTNKGWHTCKHARQMDSFLCTLSFFCSKFGVSGTADRCAFHLFIELYREFYDLLKWKAQRSAASINGFKSLENLTMFWQHTHHRHTHRVCMSMTRTYSVIISTCDIQTPRDHANPVYGTARVYVP